MAKHPDDGKFVVVEGNQRVSGNLHTTKTDAQKEVEQVKKDKPVTEGQAPQPAVKQNLYG